MAFQSSVLAILGMLLASCGQNSEEPGELTDSDAVHGIERDRLANEAQFECLREAGFAVTQGADGSVSFSDPTDTLRDAYNEAEAECDQMRMDRGLVTIVDADGRREEFGNLKALHECLVVHGLETGTLSVSEDAYVELDGDVPDLFSLNTEEEWLVASEVCGPEMKAFE